MVFPTFFNLSLNFVIRSSWSEPQSAPCLVFFFWLSLYLVPQNQSVVGTILKWSQEGTLLFKLPFLSIGGTYTLLLASGIEQRRELKHRFQGILTQRNYEIVKIHVAFKLLGLWKLLCSMEDEYQISQQVLLVLPWALIHSLTTTPHCHHVLLQFMIPFLHSSSQSHLWLPYLHSWPSTSHSPVSKVAF